MPKLLRRLPRTRAMTCPAAIAGALALFGIAGCTEPQRQAQPAFYRDLGSTSAKVDAEQARAMISAYRMNAGLGTLALDPALDEAAQREAAAMARPTSRRRPMRSRPASPRKASPAPRPISRPAIAASPKLSGWRDSPQHDRVMKDAKAKRMGIATAYAPGSKYQVYWALILAP